MGDAFVEEKTDPGLLGVLDHRVRQLERSSEKHEDRLSKLERAMYFVAGLAAAGGAVGGYLGRVLGG